MELGMYESYTYLWKIERTLNLHGRGRERPPAKTQMAVAQD